MVDYVQAAEALLYSQPALPQIVRAEATSRVQSKPCGQSQGWQHHVLRFMGVSTDVAQLLISGVWQNTGSSLDKRDSTGGINNALQEAINIAQDDYPGSTSTVEHDSLAATLQTSSKAPATSNTAQDSPEPQSVHVAGQLESACIISWWIAAHIHADLMVRHTGQVCVLLHCTYVSSTAKYFFSNFKKKLFFYIYTLLKFYFLGVINFTLSYLLLTHWHSGYYGMFSEYWSINTICTVLHTKFINKKNKSVLLCMLQSCPFFFPLSCWLRDKLPVDFNTCGQT